jgi:PAS domain S-box-containing protein
VETPGRGSPRTSAPLKVARILGAFALLGGLTTLVGWALDLPRLTDWYGTGISQMPNNALSVGTAGAALVLLSLGRSRAALVLAAFTGLVGAATLSQYLTGIDLGIDRLLAYRTWGQRGTVAPGRMGMPGSTSLMLLGVSLVLAASGRLLRFAVLGGLVTMGIALLSIIGYLFGADSLYTIPRLTVIALQTSLMLLALAMGTVASLPDQQPMKALLEDSAAALLIQRALPAVLLLPIVLGWARLRGQAADLFDTSFGTALMVVALMTALTVVLWRSAAAVRRHEAAVLEGRERLSAILGSITDAFMTLDSQGRFVFVNEQAAIRLGKVRSQLPGVTVWDSLPVTAGNEAHQQLRRAMSERTSVEYEVYDAARDRWYADRAYPSPDGGLAVYSRDITEGKGAEQRLRASEEALGRLADELRDADRNKDEFLAILAHELRNPLAPIRHSLELMKHARGDPSLIEQTRLTVERQVNQLVRLVDDLLDVSRISRNTLTLRTERVELGRIVNQAVEACDPLLKGSRHELTITLPPEPVFLDADPVRLTQIFGNLLSNACKYTAPGGSLWLTAERQGSDVVIAVRDTGQGIPAGMLDSVFEMFTQVDRTLERAQGGLGIGLTLARRLIQLHGGSIEARSEGEDRGSEFVVRLPALVEVSPERLPPTTPAGPILPARRILVVDDNPDAASSLSQLLALTGSEVHTAHDGVEAVRMATDCDPDVIFLDLGLPRMNGYDACRAIRQLPGGAAMVMVALSGWGQEEDHRKCLEAGFDGHLVKPVLHESLLEYLTSSRDGERGRA